MNIALIGCRGTGKSTVATILGRKLGWPVVSSDSLIVERQGPIPEIVSRHGWEYFRAVEEEIVSEICARDRQVIDCGGGVILRESNREALSRTAFVVWLTASVETIAARIEEDNQRPSLTGEKSFIEEVAEVLSEREPLYAKSCNLRVETDTAEPEEIALQVMDALGREERD